jgi:hypothetical protein
MPAAARAGSTFATNVTSGTIPPEIVLSDDFSGASFER